MNAPHITRWNHEFDFWKFVAAVFILLVHSKHVFGTSLVCREGYVAVEFFFVVSGFFMAKSVFGEIRPFQLDMIADEAASFLIRKIKTVFVPYCVGFAACFVIVCLNGLKRGIVGKGLVFDFLMLDEVGLADGSIVAPGWYLSVLFTTAFVLYPFMRWNKRFFCGWIAPVLSVFALGALCRRFGGVCNAYGTPFGLFSAAWVRGFGEVCLGIFAFSASEKIDRNRTVEKSASNSALRIAASLLPVLAFSWIASARADPETVLLFIAAFAALSGAGQSYSRIFPVRPCRFVGRLSLWLYLTHWAVMKALVSARARIHRVSSLFSARDAASIAITLAIYLFLCFALAIACMVAVDVWNRRRGSSARRN